MRREDKIKTSSREKFPAKKPAKFKSDSLWSEGKEDWAAIEELVTVEEGGTRAHLGLFKPSR